MCSKSISNERMCMKRLIVFLCLLINPIVAKPKIGIITSVFRGDQFIEHFLQNIMQQTVFKPNSTYNCTLYLINANSPGNEEKIIKRYLEQYPERIAYEKLDYDPGIYGVWNMAIKMSDADYIINANLDDQLAPHALETFANALERMPHIDLVYADSYFTYKPNISFEQAARESSKTAMPDFSPLMLLQWDLPSNHPMWRRALHDRFGFFDEQYQSSGDWEFWLRCVSQGAQFKKIKAILGTYYVNPQGISSKKDSVGPKESAAIYKTYKPIIENMGRK